ncbi:MAG TPA: hypothetical protein VF213_01035, partial [Dongiaceae bacterium]
VAAAFIALLGWVGHAGATPGLAGGLLLASDVVHLLAAGAWLGGQRAVLLIQSSGVGNCVNMLSLIATCRFPLLVLVTMRGEWAEFNPWQVPMGRATPAAFEIMGVQSHRVEDAAQAAPTVAAAAAMAFEGDQAIAVLFSQRMLGRKTWVEK